MKELNDPIEIMRRQLTGLNPVGEEAWEEFSSIWVPVTFKRKSVITAAGEVEKYLPNSTVKMG